MMTWWTWESITHCAGGGRGEKPQKNQDLHLLSPQTNLFFFTAAKHIHLSFTHFALEKLALLFHNNPLEYIET